jgi:hypothetical protein
LIITLICKETTIIPDLKMSKLRHRGAVTTSPYTPVQVLEPACELRDPSTPSTTTTALYLQPLFLLGIIPKREGISPIIHIFKLRSQDHSGIKKKFEVS